MSRPAISLLTDFGWDSHFAGVMKAVILSINPDAMIFDLTHGIAPQAVEEGAFVLSMAVPFLPPQSICVAVVDPGVGTERAGIALQTARGLFVGPDNGLLSAALDDRGRTTAARPREAGPVPLPAGSRAVRLSNSRYLAQHVSSTFHGRDVFAPVAAHLSAAVPLDDLGEPLEVIQVFPPWRARRLLHGRIEGRVLAIDHFGNLVTDVRADDLGGTSVSLEVVGEHIDGLSRTYQDGPGLLAYIGSAGYLEIAHRNASAATTLSAQPGDRVLVTVRGSEPSAGPGAGGS